MLKPFYFGHGCLSLESTQLEPQFGVRCGNKQLTNNTNGEDLTVLQEEEHCTHLFSPLGNLLVDADVSGRALGSDAKTVKKIAVHSLLVLP